MRLPQSSHQPFFARTLSAVILCSLVAVLPASARTTSNNLVASPTSLKFGSVALYNTETEEIVLTNNAETPVVISSITVDNSAFGVTGVSLPATLNPAQSLTLNVLFTPSANGGTSGQVTIGSNAENATLNIPISGTGKGSSLSPSPASLSFGSVSVGSTSTGSVIVTNSNSHNSRVNLNSFQIAGTGFSVSGPAVPMTLSGGESITLSVTFTPQAAGAATGSVFISGPGLMIPLTGTGSTATTGQLTISPGALSFGSVNVGSSTTQPSSLTATGGSVTVSSASVTNAQFTVTGLALPLTINPGQSVPFDVVFAPTSAGSEAAALSFSSNAPQPGSQSLSGTGIQPQYSVNLSWNASASQVTGYNVYRGTTVGSYMKINSALDPNTTYTDGTVVAGTTYYYAATAVNSSGQESGYSTPVTVAVP